MRCLMMYLMKEDMQVGVSKNIQDKRLGRARIDNKNRDKTIRKKNKNIPDWK